MKILDYRYDSRSTALYANPFIYPVLGVTGESGELTEHLTALESGVTPPRADIVKEIGDVLWYVVNTSLDVGLNMSGLFDDVIENDTLFSDMFIEEVEEISLNNIMPDTATLAILVGRLSEIAKKTLRDDGGVLQSDKQVRVSQILGGILIELYKYTAVIGVSMDHVAKVNRDKLFSRKERGVLQGSGDDR